MTLLVLLQAAAAAAPPDLTNKVDQYTKLVEHLQGLAVVLGGLLSLLAGAAVTAWHRMRGDIKAVRTEVKPPETPSPDTLREKVDGIAAAIDAGGTVRDSQHELNAQLLGDVNNQVIEIRTELNQMRADVAEIRADLKDLRAVAGFERRNRRATDAG